MRRLGKAFLTTSAVLVLVINLVMILLYGKQFYACVEGGSLEGNTTFCDVTQTGSPYLPILLLNAVVIAVIVLIWLAVRYYLRQHRP